MNNTTQETYSLNDLPEPMSEKIIPTARGCWQWTGAVQSAGYGSVSQGGRTFLTHRVSYELLVGEIPTGRQIDHLCRNKRCCNPAHLDVVTGAVNCSRTPRATKTHCLRGHALSGENLVIKVQPSGRTIRNCRTCSNMLRRKGARKAVAE